ncbi:putative heterokaryon incompatibility protein [Stachybotrys elegans]|uniref:Heterokaryon incompatibility protein n=1 Tax=Stachybotrys elegans TaxID=80388 RepID=A0A8K0SGB1_9HYPO|nr:putative heterokaryon incompatibility protein [Stachybotrys elegans]
MELVQNADDNKYTEDKTPTISITIFPSYVKIECNEEGFSRENIQALCRTARSSKAPGQGYTGQKGIGFKSVFKLANRVHIRSPPYYFQLDQTRELGMITPQWDQDFFHDHREEYQTTIVLDRICDQRGGIDPILILFLRRIDQLHLTLFKSSSVDGPAISKHFRRVNWAPDSGFVSLKDEYTSMTRHLYKHRFSVDFGGTETQRPDITYTEIVLAFPVQRISDTYVPLVLKQNFAFAYLPLGDFGFKFVIQADFLTAANRESVDEDSFWNQNIAGAIPRAFEAAISCLNLNAGDTDMTEMAKMWPLYLGNTTNGSSVYWRGIANNLIKHLSRALVVKDRTGSIRKPEQLKFLDWAHDRHGEPMFGSMCNYISPNYPTSVREALVSLHVTAPDWEWVCNELQMLHNKGLLRDKMQSKEWCSDLAKVILKPQGPQGDAKYARDLRNIPLIPLDNGTWRLPPSPDDPIYFPMSEGATIPPGLPLSLVDEAAYNCPERRRLFQLLGVKDCDVPSIVREILDYHHKLKSATTDSHLIDHAKYLYKMRKHLKPGDMRKIHFVTLGGGLQKGTSVYADPSLFDSLQPLFSGYNQAHFLDRRYFGLDPGLKIPEWLAEGEKFAKWLRETAGVALAPRFTHELSNQLLHPDFRWLLEHKGDRVLPILRKYWSFYSQDMSSKKETILTAHQFMCRSGRRAYLQNTYIPLPMLVERVQTFTKAGDKECDFLSLPDNHPENWKFLSCFGVGVDDGLDFNLWVLNQVGFQRHRDVEKSKQLYLAIQSRAYSWDEEKKVRKAFGNCFIDLSSDKYARLKSCVWYGPKGLSSKPALSQVYGNGLTRLFREILDVPNATRAEAEEHLERLRNGVFTTMKEVAEVYSFLQEHHMNTMRVEFGAPYIAVPSSSGSALEWKRPSQCVWDDEEFSKNGLKLESKSTIRWAVERHAPTTKAFFTKFLQLPDAGIIELLADLELMQKMNRDEPKRVHLLYERVESCHRRHTRTIENAFQKKPLIFIRGANSQSGRWVSLKDCIWTRSVLRHKHALRPSLKKYPGLFRETLQVSDPTMEMRVNDLLELSMVGQVEDEDDYEYIKELLQEISRELQSDKELERLNGRACWPCRTPTCPRMLGSIGSFYINDRQGLFEMFADTHAFLDFDFDTSKKIAGLLRNQGCESFLSEEVCIETEPCEPLQQDRGLTQEFRSRADALAKYIQHTECHSPYQLGPLLGNAEVWISANIQTHYTLKGTTVTKSEGGSSVRLVGKDKSAKLEIYVSANTVAWNVARVTAFPEQLVAALGLELPDLRQLQSFLQVVPESLDGLLIEQGITSGITPHDSGEILVADSVDEDSQGQMDNDNSSGVNRDAASTMSGHRVFSDPEGSTAVESMQASVRSAATRTILPPHADNPPTLSRPTAPMPRFQDRLGIPSDDSPRDGPVTPRPTPTSLYNIDNRNRNRERIQAFARDAALTPSFRTRRLRDGDGAFNMRTLGQALRGYEPAPVSTLAQANSSPRRQGGLVPIRTEEETERDTEVGFLGEEFVYPTESLHPGQKLNLVQVYTILRDTLELTDFTGEDNWTSSLRNRAGFSSFGREVSDFTYKDTEGALTRHFLQMQHSNEAPDWLSTACDNGNMPLYRLEVKTTPSQDHRTAFYMSGRQYDLAKKLRVTSPTPPEVYVILRVSGLNALEDGSRHRPQCRVYLDPYSLGQEGTLNFIAPKYAVTAAM